MKKFLTGLFILITLNSIAANYNGEIMPFKQPDGSSVDVKIFGSEYYMRAEGLDDYTLIRDEQTKWICYARLSEDQSKLLSTGIVYRGKKNEPSTLRNDLNLPFHLEISPAARQKVIKENMRLLGNEDDHKHMRTGPNGQPANQTATTPFNPLSGNIVGLTIIVDFSDEPANIPLAEYDAFCNDLAYNNYSNNGSLRTYYSDISGGLLDYENVVYGIFRAPQTFAYYDSQPYAQGAKTILGLALNWIASLGFDFSTLSTNPDNTIMAINLMYTGNPPTWAQGMWFHKGNYTAFSANGVFSKDYNTSPANAPLKLSTIAHENGHMICKWPDTYKYDQTQDGIGSFDLMCATGNPHNPVVPNPLFRGNVGWGEVVEITNFNGLHHDTANSMVSYRYTNINDTNEFYLLEHRQKFDRSTSIPDEGLTIWHIDRNGSNQTTHHEVFLEHANNDINNEYNACYKSPFATEFSQHTTPSSDWYNSDPSGLLIWGVDSPSNDVLPYYIGPGVAAPNLTVQYTYLSGDNNSNGFIEPGESADLNADAGNTGQINSSVATMTCQAIGASASYVTVNTPILNMGVIALNQPYAAAFNISLDPSTPLGTIIDIRFTLFDNADTAITTIVLVAGRQVIMNNTNATVCSSVFYDPGFLDNYNNNTNFTKTIFPSITGNYIHADFNSFDLEFEQTCNYDYLQIYDGPNSSSPLLGTFCGTSSPGSVASSDMSGALTFLFHSDAGTTGTGWEAIITCSTIQGIENLTNDQTNLYPNPTSGIVQINSPGISLITVTDAYGREIISSSNEALISSIDLSYQSAGVYFVKYNLEDKVYCRKILKN